MLHLQSSISTAAVRRRLSLHAALIATASTLTVAALMPAPALAQDASADRLELEEIVVTAQRKSESLQRAAIPVAVVSPDVLNNAGIVTAVALNAAVPALIVTKAGGANTSFYVRGVGNFTVNAYADPAIAFNVDGVYLGRPTSTTGTFFDLDRIEVLKGPQGTLYGRNATGGAINVIPAKPKLGEFSGYAGLGYGRFKAADFEGALNVPVGDRSALRLSAKVVDADGYTSDGTNDEVGQGLRAQFLTEFSDDLSVRVATDYSHQGGVGPGASYNGLIRSTNGTAATSSSVANYTYTPANFDPYSGLHSPQSKAYQSTFVIGGAFINPAPLKYPSVDNKYWGFSPEVTLKTGLGTFTFIPAYRDSKLDSIFNGPAFAAGIVHEHDKQYSGELRLAGTRVGMLDWIVGGYYFDEKINGRYTFSQYLINSFQKFDTGTKSYAAFGRATLNFTDTLRLVGGLRYTKDKKFLQSDVQTLVQTCTNGPPGFCFGGPSVPPVNQLTDLSVRPTLPGPANSVAFGTFGNRLFYNPLQVNKTSEFSKVTYRVAAEFDLSSDSLLYASFESGYRGGGFSNSIGHETYNPEFLDAFTVGSKNRFLDNRLQLNAELFYWKYKDQQVSHFGFDSNGSSSLFTENIGKSTIKGVDVDAQFLVANSTLLRGSVQYLDNTLDSFVYINPRGGTNAFPVTGCKVSDGNQGALLTYVIDCSGKQGFNAPKWSVNAGIEQTIELGSNKLVLNLDGRYRADRVIGFENLPQMHSGSDTTFDATAAFGPQDDRWAVSVYGRNLTDKAVPVLTQYSGTTGGSVSTNYAPPRTYGVRAKMKF